MSPDILLEGVGLIREDRIILHDVQLRLAAPRTAIIGANGSGKSSIARLLNGLLVPTQGRVLVQGRDTRKEAREVRSLVGMLFSDADAQILMPTPVEDVALSLRGEPPGRARERALQILGEFGLGAQAEASASALSGGQKQLLALAAVLASSPAILVADEPTTLLDLRNGRRIADLLIDGIGMPLVLVTHDLDIAVRCDEAVLVEEGTVVAQGEPADVIARYREWCAA